MESVCLEVEEKYPPRCFVVSCQLYLFYGLVLRG